MPVPSTSFDHVNMLLGLAWLGNLDHRQIQRLWFTDKSSSTVEKAIARLHREKLIARQSWSVRDVERGVTVPQPARWSLTASGHAAIRASGQYPARPAQKRRPGLIPHDARAIEAIVRLIELARSHGLSGVFVARELRLNPQRLRPVCDALVVIQLGSYDRPNLVPWSGDPAIADEARVRFAVEADNDTEPLAVIRAKAVAYQTLGESPLWKEWWRQQYGPLPVPLWVAPTEERAHAIHAQWRQAWPRGSWLVADDVGLAENRLLHWREGAEASTPVPFPSARRPAPPLRQQVSTPPAVAANTAPAPAPAPPVLVPPREAGQIIVAPPLLAEARSAGARPRPAPTPGAAERVRHRLRAAVGWCARLDFYRLRSIGLGALALVWALLLVLAAARLGPSIAAIGQLGGSTEVVPTPIAIIAAPAAQPAPACPGVRVNAERLHLRAEPGTKSAVLRVLRPGELLVPIDCSGLDLDDYTWWRVTGEDGQVGWVATKWLEPVE